MDGFTPYQNTSYQPQAPWANANVYAPWDPDGAGMQSGGPSTNGGNPFSIYGNSAPTAPQGNDWDAGVEWLTNPGAWDFKGGKKRPNITYNAPSYQGSLFTPQEGLPQYYGPSAEGGGANQNLMGTMGMGGGGQYGTSTGAPQTSPSMAGNNLAGGFYGSASPVGGSGYDSFMPSYIGQSPWGGTGYGNNGSAYGLYGSSGGTQGNMSKGTSLYQPYVPTGGSSSGGFAGYGQY